MTLAGSAGYAFATAHEEMPSGGGRVHTSRRILLSKVISFSASSRATYGQIGTTKPPSRPKIHGLPRNKLVVLNEGGDSKVGG